MDSTNESKANHDVGERQGPGKGSGQGHAPRLHQVQGQGQGPVKSTRKSVVTFSFDPKHKHMQAAGSKTRRSRSGEMGREVVQQGQQQHQQQQEQVFHTRVDMEEDEDSGSGSEDRVLVVDPAEGQKESPLSQAPSTRLPPQEEYERQLDVQQSSSCCLVHIGMLRCGFRYEMKVLVKDHVVAVEPPIDSDLIVEIIHNLIAVQHQAPVAQQMQQPTPLLHGTQGMDIMPQVLSQQKDQSRVDQAHNRDCDYNQIQNQDHVHDHPHKTLLRVRLETRRPGCYRQRVRLDLSYSRSIHLLIQATIMTKDQGTPRLKKTLKCLGKIVGYDSDQDTLWEGFGP